MLEILVYFAGWVSVYFCLMKINKHCNFEWNSRMVAFCHAFLACRNIELNMLQGNPFNFQPFGAQNTPFQHNALAFSIAYFMFETSWALWAKTEDAIMLSHHFVSLIGLFWSYYLKVSGYEACLLIWSAEFTNPLLQIRWFLRERECHRNLFAQINEVLFVCCFVFMRGVFGFFFTYHVYVTHNLLPVIRVLGYAFQIVNILFLYQISMFARKKLHSSATEEVADKEE